jgi:hypothetical protein
LTELTKKEEEEEEKRSVIRHLWSDGVKTTEIYGRMAFPYNDNCMSQWKVYEWMEISKDEGI